MNKLLLACLMLPALATPPAQAAQWVRIPAGAASLAGTGGQSYIDKSSIIRSDKSYKVWSLLSYAKEQSTPEGTPYLSMKALHLYSCAQRTTTLLSQVYYAETMGKGPVSQSFKYEKFAPEDIVPDSVADGALQVICRRKK
jgi:opacity protein-like surface antigen